MPDFFPPDYPIVKRYKYDLFISHAWEDKEQFVRPLTDLLARQRIKVWFDEFSLRPGDSLSAAIDKGLSDSKYGLVVLSPDFLKKNWAKTELRALISRESVSGKKVVVPVWYNVSAEEVRSFSLILADHVAIRADNGLWSVVEEILRLLKPRGHKIRSGVALNVAIAVVELKHHFLLVKRRDRESRLSWQFPAGIIKPGASPAETIVREVFGETGVTCHPSAYLGERVHPDTLVHVTYWLCDYLEGEATLVDNLENEAVGWFTAPEVLNIITSDIFRPLRLYLEQKIS